MFFFSSPKRSWRSSVVAHFRFNKNVFIYWRSRFGAPRDDHQDILHEITERNERASDKEKKKTVLGNVHHVFGILQSTFFPSSIFNIIHFAFPAGYLIQMRACLVILLTGRHDSFGFNFFYRFSSLSMHITYIFCMYAFWNSCGQTLQTTQTMYSLR